MADQVRDARIERVSEPVDPVRAPVDLLEDDPMRDGTIVASERAGIREPDTSFADRPEVAFERGVEVALVEGLPPIGAEMLSDEGIEQAQGLVALLEAWLCPDELHEPSAAAPRRREEENVRPLIRPMDVRHRLHGVLEATTHELDLSGRSPVDRIDPITDSTSVAIVLTGVTSVRKRRTIGESPPRISAKARR